MKFAKVFFFPTRPFSVSLGLVLIVVSTLAYCKSPAEAEPTDAIDTFLGVVREAAPGLPGYTVYRPVNLESKEKYPVVVWSNGACATSNDGHLYFLMQVAAHGFVVIAAGAPESSSSPGGTAAEDRLSQAIDWATSLGQGVEQYHNKLDTSKIATAGHSCGGIDAIWTGANDARVKAIVSLNSGCQPDSSNGGASGPLAVCRGELNCLNGPIIFLAGGPSDVAYNNSVQNFDLVSFVPAVFASHATAGHGGFFGGNTSRTVQLQAVRAVVEFLDGTLNGNDNALSFLVGPDAELGQLANWTVESTGF
jgi:dienelactone hydrolase